MAKGYMGETRHYVSFHRKGDEQQRYLGHNYKVVPDFINAKHFASFEDAKRYVEVMRTNTDYEKVKDFNAVVRSLHLEVIGFDIGTIV